MDLSLLQAQEREKVLEVLQRDKQLRAIEENRIRWVVFQQLLYILFMEDKPICKKEGGDIPGTKLKIFNFSFS